MIETGTFLLFVIALIYIPGMAILSTKHESPVGFANLFLSLTLGTCLFIASSLIMRIMHIPIQFLYVWPLVAIWYVWQKKLRLFPSAFSLSDIGTMSCLLLLSSMLVVIHLRGGMNEFGLQLSGARDSFWRLSIISELLNHFPPQLPGFAGVPLKNYHFYYDFLVATIEQLTRISSIFLYLYYISIFSAILFVIGIYSLLVLLVKNKFMALYGTVLTILTGNFSYILPFLSNQYDFVVRSNIFMSDQPFDQGHNPFNLLSYALVIGGVYIFVQWEKSGRFKWIILMGLISSILPGVKIYAAIILSTVYGIGFLIKMVQKKRILWESCLPFIMMIPSLLFIKGSGFAILAFTPGWLLTKMIEDHDRLFLQEMNLREAYYRQTGNFLRFTQIKIQQLSMYLIGNLNIRIIGFGGVLVAIVKKTSYRISLLALFGGGLIGLLLPLLVSQMRGVYDSIQFTPYGLLLFGILTVVVLDYLLIHNKEKHAFSIIVLIVVLLIGIPTNLWLLKGYLADDIFSTISLAEIEALNNLKLATHPDDVVLTDLTDQKKEWLYVPALSQRRVFLSGLTLAQQTGIQVNEREQQVKQFFTYDETVTTQDELIAKRAFLATNHISYVYLSKEGLRNESLLKAANLSKIYENTTAVIYKVL